MPTISLEKVWEEMRAAYDTTYIEELIELPGAKVYLFGGALRDMLLGLPWKDLDVRVVLPGPKEERNPPVKKIFEKHGKIILEISFSDGECYVLRARFKGAKQIVADVQVVDSLQATPGDFTISSLFIDLKTGELLQQSPHGFEDLKNRVVRPVAEERVFELEFPYIVLRSLKLACQTGCTLEPEFEKLIREHPEKVKEHIEFDLAYFKEHGKDSFTETRLGNLLSGLKTDPKRYLSLINDLGLFVPLCQGFASIAPSPINPPHNLGFTPSKYEKEPSFEEKISLFLSEIARGTSSEPEPCFEVMKHALQLDTDRADGNEFVVDPAKIHYAA